MNLKDKLLNLICEMDVRIEECRREASKANCKMDHLIAMKYQLEAIIRTEPNDDRAYADKNIL